MTSTSVDDERDEMASGWPIFVGQTEAVVDLIRGQGRVAVCGGDGLADDIIDALRECGAEIVATERTDDSHRFASAMWSSLDERGIEASIVEVRPPYGDVAEHLAAGLFIEELRFVASCRDDVERWLAGPEVEAEAGEAGEAGEAEWDVDDDRIESVSSADSESWPRLLTFAEVRDLPSPEALVDGLLYVDSLAIAYGAPKSFKSFVILDIALSIATGLAWQGRGVKPGPVVYVAAEGVSGVGVRVGAWLAHHGLDDADLWAARFVAVPIQLAIEHQVAQLMDRMAELPEWPVLIVIDTLARSALGADENSARDMGPVIEAAENLRRLSGACVLLVHHSGKNREAGMRGSSALLGAASTVLAINRDDRSMRVDLVIEAQKDAAEIAPIPLGLEPLAGSLVVVAGHRATDASGLGGEHVTLLTVLGQLDRPMQWTEWCSAADRVEQKDAKRGQRLRVDLERFGLVEQVPPATRQSPWRVTDAGRDHLSGLLGTA